VHEYCNTTVWPYRLNTQNQMLFRLILLNIYGIEYVSLIEICILCHILVFCIIT
jgi:hypothetical protein